MGRSIAESGRWNKEDFPLPPLPRGRNRLSQQEIAENQRRRLLAAMAESVAAHGYAAASVERVIERAGVSRGTFYEHFRNRHECLLAAHQAIYEGLAAVASEVCGEEEGSWEDKVCSVIGLTLEFASHSPDQARLLALDTVAAGAESARRGLEAADLFAGMLRTGREYHPEATDLPEVTERALIGAVASAVNWCLLNEESLERLKPQLVYLVLAPYVGTAAAATQAAKAGPA